MEVEVIKKNIDIYKRNRFDFNAKLRVAAYCRVSTGSQEQKDSYESQVKHYTQTIQSNKNWIFVDVYADEAMTGTIDYKRTDLLRLINDAMLGKIDLILTKSIARFARNTVDTLKYVRMLKEKNVAIYFEEEHINTLEMAGELLLTILSSVAQQEVQNTSDNVKLGLKMKMTRGEMVGANNCYGYKIDKKHRTLIIIEKEAEVVRLIFKLYIEGYGTKGIADYLEEKGYKTRKGNTEWCTATITRILKNEKYMGDLLMHKSITIDPIAKKRIPNNGEEDKYYVKNHHPAIISEEIYNKAQEVRKSRSRDFTKRNFVGEKGKNYSFTGKIFCGFCNSVYTRVLWTQKEYPDYSRTVWKCRRADKKGRKYCPDSIILYNEVIENIFIDIYNSLCINHEKTIDKALKILEQAINMANDNIKKRDVDKEIQKTMLKIDELVDLKINKQIDIIIYQNKYKDLSIELENLRKEKLENANKEIDQKNIKDRIKEYKNTFHKNARMKTFDKEVFDVLVRQILVGSVDEKGNKDPYTITIIMNTDLIRKCSYLDYNIENTKKNYKDVTGDVLAKNFRPSKIHNTIRRRGRINKLRISFLNEIQ